MRSPETLRIYAWTPWASRNTDLAEIVEAVALEGIGNGAGRIGKRSEAAIGGTQKAVGAVSGISINAEDLSAVVDSTGGGGRSAGIVEGIYGVGLRQDEIGDE